MLNDSSKEKGTWLKTNRSFLKNTLKIGTLLGVMAALIIPANVWPSTSSKLLVVVICAVIYLALTLYNYYRPNN